MYTNYRTITFYIHSNLFPMSSLFRIFIIFGMLILTILCSGFFASAAPASYTFWDTAITGSITPPIWWIGGTAGRVRFDVAPYIWTGLAPIFYPSGILTGGTIGTLSWFFWLESVGWVSMGHGVPGGELTIDCPSDISENCIVNGWAWSQNAGWILFNPIPSNAWSGVLYNRVLGKLEWFAWSQNLGWIPMMGDSWDGIYFCMQTPTLNIASWSIAHESQEVEVQGCSNESGTWTLHITPRDLIGSGTEKQTFSYIGNTPVFTWVDISIATIYSFELIDPSGDTLKGEFPVYAALPSDTLSGGSLASATPWNKLKQYCDSPFHNPSDICPDGAVLKPTYYFWSLSATSLMTHVADGEDAYVYGIGLRDMYGNPVYTVPWVKDIILNLGISNNVDRVQVSPLYSGIVYTGAWDFNIWDALYTGLSGSVGMFGSWQIYSWYILPQKMNGVFEVKIISYAPTKEWYKYTTASNDAYITNFNYTINGTYWFTTGSIDLSPKFFTGKLKFTPAATVVGMSGTAVNLGGYMYITGSIRSYTTKSITGVDILHGLSLSGWVNAFLAVFRDPGEIDGWLQGCFADPSNPSSYSAACSRGSQELSILQISNANIAPLSNIIHKFRLLFIKKSSTGVNPSPPYSTLYESLISYSIDGKKIVFNSYRQSEDDTLSGWLVNNSLWQVVKILWNTNGDRIYETIQSEKQSRISSLTRAEVRDAIRRNVEILSRSITTSTALDFDIIRECPLGMTWYDLPATYLKSTFVSIGCDIRIQHDVSGNIWIIALKDENGNGWNIWIDKDVKNIAAVIFAESSLLAGDGNRYYAEMSSSAHEKKKQLYIFGTIISNNTIWGAAQVGDPICPSGISSCTREVATRYDFNHFRSGYGWLTPAERVLPVNAAILSAFAQMYSEYGMIIEYNPAVLTNPPPWFKNIMQ